MRQDKRKSKIKRNNNYTQNSRSMFKRKHNNKIKMAGGYNGKDPAFLLSDKRPEFSIQCHWWRHNIQPDVDPPVDPSFDVLLSLW